MIFRIYFTLLLLTIGYTKVYSQDKGKKDLYLLFEDNASKKMFKYPIIETQDDIIYEYQVPNKTPASSLVRIRLNVKYKAKSFELHKDFVEKNAKGLDWINNERRTSNLNLKFIGYKDFPYKHVYIVEKDRSGKYYAVEVESYMGSH